MVEQQICFFSNPPPNHGPAQTRTKSLLKLSESQARFPSIIPYSEAFPWYGHSMAQFIQAAWETTVAGINLGYFQEIQDQACRSISRVGRYLNSSPSNNTIQRPTSCFASLLIIMASMRIGAVGFFQIGSESNLRRSSRLQLPVTYQKTDTISSTMTPPSAEA